MNVEPFSSKCRMRRCTTAPPARECPSPLDFGNDEWSGGTNGDYLRVLTDYWRTGYDWRVHERSINAIPQFRTVIDGVPVHFQHVRSKGRNRFR
jgi:hypothetical protein